MSKSIETDLAIIGAGIGGLTTALALQQKGIKSKIYEGSTQLKPVGAGIIIANNAMQVFKHLGIHDEVEKAGNRLTYLKITDEQLNKLSLVDLTPYEKKYGVHNVAIHRGKLQRILADAVGNETILLSKRLLKIESGKKFKLTFEDQTNIHSSVVIGADGIRSVVRNQLFNNGEIRNARQICWRGICDLDVPEKYQHELNEAWGKGKRFGFVKLNEKKVYWYALINSQSSGHTTSEVLEHFETFHPDIARIITSTPKDQIIINDIIDLKPMSRWQMDRACLIGDAAHATTPNLGQGACQAIEDAYVLAQLMNIGSIEETFKAFELRRRKKAHKIVKTSWTIGKMAHWESSGAVWFRNFMLKSLPSNQKQLDMIFDLNA